MIFPAQLASSKNGVVVRIKICGITNAQDAQYCEYLGAHALGFLFYRGSKRFVAAETVVQISQKLGPFVQKVGVFVNASVAEVKKTADVCGLSMVQLHGDESPAFVDKIGIPVIKGFRVGDNFDYSILNKYRQCYLLLDAWSENEMGGAGKTFNWQKIPEDIRPRIILAGGVSEKNIEQIYRDIHPAAVDLSSSVESSPGIKDHNKLARFFDRVNELTLSGIISDKVTK
jgi:phosphoribosylanthranilate isomerase